MPAEQSVRRAGSRLRSAGRLALILTIVLFVALLAYGLGTKSPNTTIDESLARAEAPLAPGFKLSVLQAGSLGPTLTARLRPALADGRLSLRELRGTPVVLNFWASWCVPCRAEAPLLERGWRTARRSGVLFVGLNMQDLTGDARDFIREFHNTYLNVRDPTDATARKWGATGLPETYFLTRRDRVVAHVIGVVSPDQLRRGIRAALAGRPLAALEGGERRATR